MEDNNQQKKNKFQVFYSQFRTSFFNIMFELLKEKNTSLFLGCFIILVMFTQLIGHLFDPKEFEWKDQFFLNFIIQVCNYSRLIKAINDAGSAFFYWVLIIFGIMYLLTMIALLLYMNYFLKNRKHYAENVVKLLRYMILLMYWVFYMPFYEAFLSILNCQDGVHYIDKSIQCFQGIHIFYIVLCIVFLIILFSISMIIALLFNETQPVQEDCLSRLESSFEVALVIYRSIVATFTNFCNTDVCSWVLISVFIISSAMLCYQYYKQIPYYNQFVSVFCGSLIFIYFWISVNAMLMKLLDVNGHIVIIFAGMPLVSLLVKNLRDKRIESLIKTNIDKVQLDIDALIQVHNMTDFSKGINKDQAHRMTMIGIINIHVLECQNAECPCKDEYELFDVTTNQFSSRNEAAPHLDEVFLNHFIKRLYEDSLNKFINSPSIHIAFSFYLFKVMKNIHASLIELNIAQKKKPSLQQQFTIFRYKNIIEEYIQQDHLDHKAVYPELSNVIEFERLFGEMQRAIEKVCNLQVEFWTHLTTVVPDLNILNDLGKKVYEAGEEVEFYWGQLCKINPNYQQALSIYGEYLKDIRNHEHLGNIFIERAFNQLGNKKSLDEHAQSSDILFSEDTTVIHVSGNKESVGKILKTSQGLSKVFGYSKTEVIGHSVNILMPTLFARKHTDFLERFFKTGRQIIFYHERSLFATHRNGHCFQMKILVKQMPNLTEGIQYVGMIKPIISDFEYMLTDMTGVIDSFSKGITSLLGLTPNLFKDKDTQINIQLLAPDLINFFVDTQKRGGKAAKSKFREPGGEGLMLIVPRDFNMIAKSEAKSNPRSGGGRNRGKSNASNFRTHRSPMFREFLKYLSKPKKTSTTQKIPNPTLLLQQREYQECERKRDVKCEITCLDIKCSSTDSMKMLVFKFSNNMNKDKNGKFEGIGFGEDMRLGVGNNLDYARVNGDPAFDYCKQNSESSHAAEEVQPVMPNYYGGVSQATTAHYNQQNMSPQVQIDSRLLLLSDQKAEEKQQFLLQQQQQQQQQPVKSTQQSEQATNRDPVLEDQMVEERNEQSEITDSKMTQQSENKKKSNVKKQLKFQDEEQMSSGRSAPKETQQSQTNQSNQNQVKEESEKENESEQMTSGLKTDSEGSEDQQQTEQQQQLQLQPQIQQQPQPQIAEVPKEEAKVVEEGGNLSDAETPRIDVSGLKLDSAQKEKNSFLQELKKQSFLISEDSTQKMEIKDSVNVSAIKANQNQDISSKERSGAGNPQSNNNSNSLGAFNVQQEADKMVKKQNLNNMQGRNVFIEDDINEEEDLNEDSPEEDDQSKKNMAATGTNASKGATSGKGKSVNSEISSNQAGKTDESLEQDEEPLPVPKPQPERLAIPAIKDDGRHYSAELNEGKKAKRQQTKFNRALPSESSDEDDENEEFKEEGNENDGSAEGSESEESRLTDEENSENKVNSAGRSNAKQSSNSRGAGSMVSSKQKDLGDRQPLLPTGGSNIDSNILPRPAQFGYGEQPPNIADLRKGFDDDQASDFQSGSNTNSRHQMQGKLAAPQSKFASRQQTMRKGNESNGGESARNRVSMPQPPSKQNSVRKAPNQQQQNAGQPRYRLVQIKKKDTGKIRTNPKYKCVDEGESGEEDDDIQKNEDYQALSSKELDFRETIIKFEKKKRRKERKMKEREQKRIKALNGEDGNSSLGNGDPSSTQTPGGSEDDDDDSQSKSSISSSDSDTKEGNTPDEHGDRHSAKASSISKPDADGVSSVSSRQNKTERNHYILRTAIDEKYIPSSIQNLRYAANFIFLILLLLSIIYYVIQISLFGLINQNIKNIHNSESRVNYIIDITLRTRTLILVNNNYLVLNQTERDSLLNTTIAELRDSATTLKVAQTDLSLKTASLSADQLEQINPDDVQMKYLKYPNMPDMYEFSIWEAIMEIVVSAYRISTLPLNQVVDNFSTVYFVMQNSLNSVMLALKSSTDAIISESDNNRQSNMQVFLYLLIAASCSMFFSILFLIPVINKVKKNKQEVLELFTHRNIEKHIDDQLKVCRNFVSMRLQQTNENGAQGEHDIDGNENGQGNGQGTAGDKELQNELNNNKYMKRMKKKNKGKKWKPLNSDFGATLLKFLLFICIIEGYFLANYLLSYKFLQEVQDLTQELKLLISRQPVQSFLLLIQKEMIYSNGTALIEGQLSEQYVPNYQESLYDEEEQLLDKFSQNFNYHSASYNDEFNNLVYSNLCQYVPEFSADPDVLANCESFNQGILQKGIYSSVIKYWDFLRQLNHDFLESSRSLSVIKQFLNDDRLKVAEQMQDFYFKIALSKLVTQLEADIDNLQDSFNFQNVQNRSIFIIYIIYIVGLYYFIWRKFVSILQNELWKTKSMLGILPTKLCFEIEEIRYFIYAHSSNDFISSKI